MHPYERKMVAFYAANSIRAARGSLGGTGRALRELRELWQAGAPALGVRTWRLARRAIEDEPSPPGPEEVRSFLAALETAANRPVIRKSALQSRVECLARLFSLDAVSAQILALLVRTAEHPCVESLLDTVASPATGWMGPSPIGHLLGLRRHKLRPALAETAPLRRSGLILVDDDDGEVRLAGRVRQVLGGSRATPAALRDALLGKPVRSTLEWGDFAHLAQARGLAERLLAAARRAGRTGVNLLFYGAPGTGKTQFARLLAERIGAPAYEVGECEQEDGDPGRDGRIAELLRCRRLLAAARAVIIVNEADDLLAAGDAGGLFLLAGRRRLPTGSSKAFLHRLIETAPDPTIWTTNHIDEIDAAVLRRMTYAVEFPLPPTRVRERVWQRVLRRNGLSLAAPETAALARDFEAVPALAETAARAAGWIGGGASEVRATVESIGRAMRGGIASPPKPVPEIAFDPALARADTDLERLAARTAASRERRFSFCLSGPSGTGKSAYARYLAERMGLEMVQRRASDLKSKWVGETEQNIARAFAEARDAGAFLVFDEADSFLADRSQATHGWELGEVNEMLTWMESHPLPFACTTNLIERIDPAAMRRFTFKVRFDYLDRDGASLAFRRFFGLEPPDGLCQLDTLTPGDFAVIAHRAAVLGATSGMELLDALAAEKPCRGMRVGFR